VDKKKKEKILSLSLFPEPIGFLPEISSRRGEG
jgi:hypothetical protein